MDGVEREERFCVNVYQYNFSIANDSRIEVNGLAQLRRAKASCEAIAGEGAHLATGILDIGDQVGCWRPFVNLHHVPVEQISCARPRCTLADVYLCDIAVYPTPGMGFGSRAGWANFGRLVLGSIDADFWNQIHILQHFSRSTRFANLCTYGIQSGKPRKATRSFAPLQI